MPIIFLFLLTINLKLLIIQIEIKIVNKEAATKRNALLLTLCMVAVPLTKRCGIGKKWKAKKSLEKKLRHPPSHCQRMLYNHGWEKQQTQRPNGSGSKRVGQAKNPPKEILQQVKKKATKNARNTLF